MKPALDMKPARLGWGGVSAMALFVIAIAAAGYAYKGKPGLLIGRGAPALEAAGGDAASAEAIAQMTALTDQLAARMQERPDDPKGWAMLGRSQAALGRYADAATSLAKASAMQPEDAGLLVDWADALAMSQGQKLDGAPLALIEKALAIDPNHLKALSLAGAAAFVKNDYTGALKHWEKLVAVGPPDDDFVREMKGAVAQARQLAGLPPAVEAPGAKPAATAGASVTGRVSLSAALAKQVAPEDTVFISARAADGATRMPLAVLKRQVKDLPLDFTLDDSLAMSPAAKLSSAKSVIVTARVSPSGQAMPKPEDLGAQSKPVELGAKAVTLEIAGPIGR